MRCSSYDIRDFRNFNMPVKSVVTDHTGIFCVVRNVRIVLDVKVVLDVAIVWIECQFVQMLIFIHQQFDCN